MSLRRLVPRFSIYQPFNVSRQFSLRTMATQMPAGEADASAYKPRYIDVGTVSAQLQTKLKSLMQLFFPQIGINLADPIFRGRYHGSQKHPDDLEGVMKRAHEIGCAKFMVTGSDFTSAREALQLAEQYR